MKIFMNFLCCNMNKKQKPDEFFRRAVYQPSFLLFAENSVGVSPVVDLKTLQKYEAFAKPTAVAMSSIDASEFTSSSLDFSTL